MTNENSTGSTHHHLLMQIIGSMLSGATDNANLVENLTRDAIIPVSNLAKKHDLAHIVARFISQNGIDVDPTLNDKLQREDYLAAYRNRQMGHTYGEICSAFDEAGIDYLPLKGSVIRPFYPYESMRTSCDIDILVKEGYVKGYQIVEDGKQGIIRITLKYGRGKQRVIQGLRRISKPGLRIYSNCEDMPKVQNGLGIAIISTSKGIMTDKKARELNVGGEVIAFVW